MAKLSKRGQRWRSALAHARRELRKARKASERSRWLEAVNQARRRFRKELAASGVCIGCQSRVAVPGRVRCRACTKKHREQNTGH
jgi:hypothetical protein